MRETLKKLKLQYAKSVHDKETLRKRLARMEEAVFIAQQKVLEIGSAGGRDIFDEVLHVLKGAKSD